MKTKTKALAVLALLVLPMLLSSLPVYGYTYTEITSDNFRTKSSTLYITNLTTTNSYAEFNITLDYLQYLDFSEVMGFNVSDGFATYTWRSNLTVVFPNGLKITDFQEVHNDWWGLVHDDDNKHIYTTLPNGTKYDCWARAYSFWKLRFVVWRSYNNTLNILWTFMPYPNDNVIIAYINDNPPIGWSWFQYPNYTDWDDFSIKFYLTFEVYGAPISSALIIEYNKDQEAPYGLICPPVHPQERGQPPRDYSWYSAEFYYVLFDIVGATVGMTLHELGRSAGAIVDQVLAYLGLGWLSNIIATIIGVLMLIFNIAWEILPYIGIIIFIHIITYVVRFDFTGLFDFFIWIYEIMAGFVSAIVQFFAMIAQAIDTIVPL